ncbi:MAG: MBL fold metallo-hydrolase [Gammaproteobacteria bacterium]|nr:MBL fold metallo-hydrolase [Gammaproteobacteria bacterium]
MDIRVLGCSGGVSLGNRTTSFLVGDDILIDAGSGVGDLTLEEMRKIRHIFITHTHLDHIHCIPLLLDTIFDSVTEPVVLHGSSIVLEAIHDHLFNGVIWPDFSVMPSMENPVVINEAIEAGESIQLGDLNISAIEVNHIVPTVAFIVSDPSGVFAFSGDTTTNDTLWEALNKLEKIDILVVETAFSNSELDLCRNAKHYCPISLAEDLKKLRHQTDIYLTHAKPGEEEKIFQECHELIPDRKLHKLHSGQRFKI